MKVDPSIFKAYDIRGIFPSTLNNEVAYRIAQAYVDYVKPKGEVLVGNDVRIHSEELKESVINGLTSSGVDVVDVGLISTDMYYFAVGHYGFSGGVQVTASHNPPEWHGMKMVREQVKPLTFEKGITQIKDYVINNKNISSNKKGNLRKLNIEEEYSKYILSWLNGGKLKSFKIVYDPNFGYAGKIFEKIVSTGKLPFDIKPLNAEPNGNFPKGRPDPFVPENRPEFVELVKSTDSDIGIAWDADADRAFFCADGGLFIEPYFLNTLLIKKMLKKFPNQKIIYDPRYTWALIDTITQNGGTPVVCRVGHSYIKEKMRSEDALFATESSGHTYYRDFWYADSGMIPVMQIAEYLSENKLKLSDAISDVMNKYFISGEINTKVKDAKVKIKEISEKYKDAQQSTLDGISIEYDNFRFTVRPSNTEPLLRLTLEAKSKSLMEEKRDEVLELIRS